VNCERCGERPASLRYTEVQEGEARKLRICEACAASLGFGSEPEQATEQPAPVAAGEPEPKGEDPRRCPACGLGAGELKTQTLLGCPTCYETFADRLDELLRRVHGAVRHEGRLPGGRTVAAPDLDALQRDLEAAIARDDFEAAARLRDLLRRARRRTAG
jgi:protein arginine kinase activator